MLNRPLEKPDYAHPQRQQAEARAHAIMRLIWGSYAIAICLTLVFQVFIRLAECEGSKACAVSLAKAVAWSVGWPFYWAYYLIG